MVYSRLALVAVVCAGLAWQARADLTKNMIAQWTFNQPDSGALVDSVSKIRFEEKGAGGDQTTTYNPDGTATLGRGRLLVAAAINTEKFPQLAKSVTIWARIRVDEPTQLAFIMGLLDADKPADWKQQTLCLNYNPQGKPSPTIGGFGWLTSGKPELTTGSESKPLLTGEFKTVAIAWDGDSKTMTFYFDGVSVQRRYPRGDATLQAFKSLAVGRLKESSTTKITVDEVRIYDVALTPDWIGEIEVSK